MTVGAVRKPHPHWLGGVLFTVVLIGLIALAIPAVVDFFFLIMLAVVVGGAAFFYLLFPGSRQFAVVFANALAVYTCVFVFFMHANFASVSVGVRPVGFILPVLAFLAGAWLRRRQIAAIVSAGRLSEERHFGHLLRWLVPVFGIGALTFILPELRIRQTLYDALFLLSMGGIAAVVGVVSRQVATFLLDVGILFEDFFLRMAELVVPAFAFFTFYSLNIILFASIYRILDRFSAAQHFRIEGQLIDIAFPEALYFSAITLSTVGYGEIVPATSLARIIVVIQIVFGVLLLLFGFSEIIAYTRARRQSR